MSAVPGQRAVAGRSFSAHQALSLVGSQFLGSSGELLVIHMDRSLGISLGCISVLPALAEGAHWWDDCSPFVHALMSCFHVQ